MNSIPATANQSRHVVIFFILAYAISWSIGIPLAMAEQWIIPAVLPGWTHYLLAFGPLLSAMIVTGFSHGLPGLKDLGRRMVRAACPKWWLVALSPLIAGCLVILILNRFTGAGISSSTLGQVNYLPPLGIAALPLWIFTFGFGEETGWRGYALPRLQKRRSALAATMILATFWALWHLPQFFYQFDPTMAVGWLIGLFAGAMILTWLYNSTDESILIVAIWHGSFNFMTSTGADSGFLPALLSALVILFAGIVVVRYKPKTLTSI